MKTVVGCLILIAVTLGQPYGVSSQELTLEDRMKLKLAETSADRFVERFRQTLDFGTVWGQFHMSDISCTVKANGIFTLHDYERLKLDNELLERFYVALMNYFYLMNVHDLSSFRIDSTTLSEEANTPKEIRQIEKRLVYTKANGKEPKTARDLEQMIVELRRLARLYRKYIPRNAMKSATWRANDKYLMNRSDTTHLVVSTGHPDFCIPAKTKYYIVDRGLFYFYIIEEQGKMKIAGLAMDLN